MIRNALRSLWAEPRVADAPARGWRDWVLVGVLMVTALLEGVLRDDVAWRPFATIVAVGLAPVLLWRRTRPLACVVVAFGTTAVVGLASLAAGVSAGWLHAREPPARPHRRRGRTRVGRWEERGLVLSVGP